MLKLSGIRKIYRMGDNEVHALRSVDLTIEDGDFVAIMGPSGSGKSTLMHILGLLDVPTEGSYSLNGREVSGLTEDELAVLRREEIGFIFQQFNLLPRMTAAENVALPLLYSERYLDASRSGEFLRTVGLEPRAGHRPNELSGGQQQRVAIARALINRPRMILADEPTGNLDSVSEKEVMEALKALNARGITVIVVTHEEEIGQQARRLIRMRDGVVHSDERTDGSQPSLPQPAAPPPASRVSAKPRSALASVAQEVFEHLRQGFKTLAANKVRTALSMLGILIGVAAVVAMLALGRGAQKAIETQLTSLGSNLLVLRSGGLRVGGVSQGAGAVARLSLEDARAIRERIPGIKDVSPSVNGKAQVTFRNRNWSTSVLGTGPAYVKMRSSQPELGRFFTEEDGLKRLRVAVIGTTVARELFGEASPIGETIKINKVSFQVIGLLPEKGGNGFTDRDDMILVPVQTAMHRLLGRSYVDSIDIEMADASLMTEAQDGILDLVLTRHRIPPTLTDGAFQIRNMADIQAALSESSRTMGLLLASIAAISLLVGGIGIMNIMLVSVTERTKEIGLRKAIGARRRDILLQFLVESVVVSLVGGLIGIALGWGITGLLSALAGWSTSISVESVLLSFFFSASIGVLFGIYPARKAAVLPPIQALRYE